MIGPLLAHITPCETVELCIDQRDQSVEGGSVALAPRPEELGRSAVGIRRHDSFSSRMAPSIDRGRYGTPREAVPGPRMQESDMNQPVMDHWTTVKRIHQSALDLDPSERAAFVNESCGGDEALRREVEALLPYASEAEAFLERPAVDIAPTPPGEAHEATLVGRTISHYQVLSLLGAGGMGEVYLARHPGPVRC